MKIVIGGTFVYAEIKECRIKSIFNADLLQLVQNVGKQTDVFTLKDTRLNSITIALSFDGFIQKLQYLEIVNVILLTQVLYCTMFTCQWLPLAQTQHRGSSRPKFDHPYTINITLWLKYRGCQILRRQMVRNVPLSVWAQGVAPEKNKNEHGTYN